MNIRKTIAAFLSVCLGGSALCTFPANAEEDSPGMKFETWQDAYWYFLNAFEEGKEPDEDRNLGPMYETKDITGDGIPELFISESAYPLSQVQVYTYQNGSAEYLMSGGGNGILGYNTDKSHDGIYLITSFINQGIMTYNVYIYNNKAVSPIAKFTADDMYADEKNPAKYTFNDKEVTKEEFDKEFSKYKDLEISYAGRKEYFDERYATIDDVVYHYYLDHFEVAGADVEIKDMKIADEIRGIKVTGIHEHAVEKLRKLESVTFGSNIEYIGRNSFEGCSALKSVTIPENVRDIGEQAFLDCGSLEEVTILNPECSIWDFWEGKQPLTFCNTVDKNGNTVFNGVIKGQKNSTAEKYADIFKLDFEVIESKNAKKIFYGDVNGDSVIDATDATAILTAYAKSSVEGGELGFDEKQKKAADVNRDNVIDGMDATSVLTYYTRASVGYGGTLEEFMNNGYSFDNFVYGDFTSGLESDDQAKEFLNGKWEMMPHGNPLNNRETAVDISFSSETGEISFAKGEEKAHGTFEPKNLFEFPRGCYNLMTVEINYSTNGFTQDTDIKFPENALFETSSDYQFIGTYINGIKYLAVREIGNGITQLTYELGENNKAKEGLWVFREADKETVPVSQEDNDKMKIKDKSFYAFRWFDSGDKVYLQEMTVEEKQESGLIVDGNFKSLTYTYPNSGHAMTAVEYKVKNGEKLANSGSYKPSLVIATTDSSGDITEIRELEYLSTGLYISIDQ